MKTSKLFVCAAALCCTALPASQALSQNTLLAEIWKTSNSEGTDWYMMYLTARKEGATTLQLETALGVFVFYERDGEFRPPNTFLDNYWNVSLQDVQAFIAEDWTLTWDEGRSTETVATINIGQVSESDFLPVPRIIGFASGETADVPAYPTVEWHYDGTPPCVAQPDIVRVRFLTGGTMYDSGPLAPCATLSWTSPHRANNGHSQFYVWNTVSDYRRTADGIGGPITGDPWILEGDAWCTLSSIDARFLDIVSVETKSFGEIKALFR